MTSIQRDIILDTLTDLYYGETLLQINENTNNTIRNELKRGKLKRHKNTSLNLKSLMKLFYKKYLKKYFF